MVFSVVSERWVLDDERLSCDDEDDEVWVSVVRRVDFGEEGF